MEWVLPLVTHHGLGLATASLALGEEGDLVSFEEQVDQGFADGVLHFEVVIHLAEHAVELERAFLRILRQI